MTEATVHADLVAMMFVAAVFTALSVLVVTAPYGRHARGGWGPPVSTRTGWLIMEVPAIATFCIVYALGTHRAEAGPVGLLALWVWHYGYRGLVYPFRIKAGQKPMPLSIAAMGGGFNVYNGYLNARQVSEFGVYPASWLVDPRFVAGAVLFFVGWLINQHADAVLLALRKPGETGYKVPNGGLYRWISCPNYLGELIEWTGWALASWSFAGLGFALYTAANLVPRALDHHRWYRRAFPDYPPERRAVIPGLL